MIDGRAGHEVAGGGRRVRRWQTSMIGLLALLAACSEGQPDSAGAPDTTAKTTPATTTTSVASEPLNVCTSREGGYRVRYPADWHENDPNEAPRCRYFDPEAFEVPYGTDDTPSAIILFVLDDAFDDAVPAPGDHESRELSREATVLDGRRAVRVEKEANGVGLFPAGYRTVSWHVELGDRTLWATAFEHTTAGTLEETAAVMEEIVASAEALPESERAACSAADLRETPEPQPKLAQAAATMRASIVEAATACDLEGLAELALAGPGDFTYSFGSSDDPAGFWRELEGGGERVMHALVALLDLPHAIQVSGDSVSGDSVQYVWPSIFAYDDPEDVPDELAAQSSCYCGATHSVGPSGANVGYRIGITDAGDWTFFVAGD